MTRLGASFRDPSGYVESHGGIIRRVVTREGAAGYEQLVESGLYRELTECGMLIPHAEEPPLALRHSQAAHLLRPEPLQFVSYPYEWCFSQLKDAALLTLEVQERALAHGMSLKDASAFNVQFHRGRPVFIDTLSFEAGDGGPWVAYEQFCRHFLAPLLLMQRRSVELGRFCWASLDGISLPLASRLLGFRSLFHMGDLVHVHLHARAQSWSSTGGGARRKSAGARHLLESLRSAVETAELPSRGSAWSGYVDSADHYSPAAMSAKIHFVRRVLERSQRGLVYDIGGNTGVFSRQAAEHGMNCVLYDRDPLCVEAAYLRERSGGQGLVLPLVMDLSNPTPALGFNLEERAGLFGRPRARLVFALALMHHLRLGANIPFRLMAECLARLGERLVIEYVDPADPMAQRMSAGRRAPLPDYNYLAFLDEFTRHFELEETMQIPGMQRKLLVFTCKRNSAL